MQRSNFTSLVERHLADKVRGRVDIQVSLLENTGRPDMDGWVVFDYTQHVYVSADSLRTIDGELNFVNTKGLYKSLVEYEFLPMSDILRSNNPVTRALGMLDQRLARVDLLLMASDDMHPLVMLFYKFRIKAENLATQLTMVAWSMKSQASVLRPVQAQARVSAGAHHA